MAHCYPVRIAGCDADCILSGLRVHRIWRLLALFRRLNIQHFQRSVAAARAVISD